MATLSIKSLGKTYPGGITAMSDVNVEITKRIAEAARTLRLEEYLDREPANLSGGQHQRVAMGRAIGRDPKVFPFDEPLSNLDAKLRTQIAMGIRPKHLHQNTAGDTWVERLVGFIKQLGADTVVHGTLAGWQSPLAVRLNEVQTRNSSDNIALSCIAQKIYLFDGTISQRRNWTHPCPH